MLDVDKQVMLDMDEQAVLDEMTVWQPQDHTRQDHMKQDQTVR